VQATHNCCVARAKGSGRSVGPAAHPPSTPCNDLLPIQLSCIGQARAERARRAAEDARKAKLARAQETRQTALQQKVCVLVVDDCHFLTVGPHGR
jgi:hypothetical protein